MPSFATTYLIIYSLWMMVGRYPTETVVTYDRTWQITHFR